MCKVVQMLKGPLQSVPCPPKPVIEYGIVHKTSLNDGCQVVIKVLKESKGSVEEFVNEVVTISRKSHVKIVSLLGFCYEMNKQTLIYEFMSNDLSTLYQIIIISVARGVD
ncbi:hypothetical protein HN873_034984 [Arachis hypogaea]